ncbi:hypothetical protein TWF694_002194 [Orbilia ellipsospora]|uniref:Rhodopsin domain-containing protein n=1 Tax=Orbilia ellipsospora TaxID=2528407 RepID=A0AAV9X7F1_9PEZI
MQPLICVSLGAIRTSLLIFIQRLSKPSSGFVYTATCGLIPFNILHISAAILVSIFRCTPIRTVWAAGGQTYTCLAPAVGYTLVAVGLAIDIAIFVLPAILVTRLDISSRKKLQSIVMFALGGGGCIIESLRFGQLHKAQTSPDITYNAGEILIYLFLQVVLGMLCCCAPAAKIFYTEFQCRGQTKFTDSRSTWTKAFGSCSNSQHEDTIEEATHVGSSEYSKENVQKPTGEAPASPTFGEWDHSPRNIVMDGRELCAAGENNRISRIMAMTRIMNLEEILRMDSWQSVSLGALPNEESSSSTRHGGSQIAERS